MKTRLTLLFSWIVLIPGIQAQIQFPRLSPMATVEQQLGLTSVKVSYSRPAVRGRKIMGELVPFGRIWRVGANESTKFSTSDTLHIVGHMLPPGTYALYAFPSATEWEIVFHSNTDHWGDGRDAYRPEEDVFRIAVVPLTTQSFKENFEISFDRIDHNGMEMIWEWEYTRIEIPVQVNTYARMIEEINLQILENPTAQTYYEAGRYLQEQDTLAPTSLDYLKKAIEIGGDTYYYYRVKSLVEAKLGQLAKAIESARRSLDLAAEQGKDEFVRMNQKNIDNWQKMLADESIPRH